MKFAALPFALLLIAGCSQPSPKPAPDASLPGPFIGLDASAFPAADQRALLEASEDFRAVVSGRRPVHATLDITAPLPADGGTTYYQGTRYRLTVLRSLSTFGGFRGIAYGPILTFDKDFAPGNTSEISDIKVYSTEQLSLRQAE